MKQILVVFLLGITSLWAQQINQLDSQGRKHGLWKGKYEPSQRPRYEGTFEHGKEVGTFKFFDDTKQGSVIATREFRPDGSAWTTFFDQKKNKVSEGLVNANKKYEGEWLYYHFESSQIMTREWYKNGQLNGLRTVYYKSGKIAETAQYKDGKKDGNYKKLAENENVLEEVTFVNGLEHGPAAYYNPDGTLASKGAHVNGAKKGKWEFYREGKLWKTEKYPLNKKFQKFEREDEKKALQR